MKPYRPSNGTEGMWFDDKFCNNCVHMNPDPESEKHCEISMRAFCYGIKDPEYPVEWVQNDDGTNERCTAFKKWDWKNNGNPNDPDNPFYKQPEDPNQIKLF